MRMKLQQVMALNREERPTVEGTVERVVFRNRDNGYTVLRLAVDTEPLLTTVVGNFQRLDHGERVRFTGEWTVDPRHGRQFKAETCLQLQPATLKGIEKFLGSGLIPGIGPVMARRIVVRFSLDTLEVIEHDPRRLAEVEGIGPKRARAIGKAMVEKRAVKEVMVFLESAGVSPAFAHRIFKRYGNDAIRRVSENPYRLAADVHGIGFLSADRVAAHLGVPPDSPHRAEAGLLHALEELAGEGHVFARQKELVPRAQQLLDVEVIDLERALDRLALMGGIRRDGQGDDAAIYLPRLHGAESDAAAGLTRLLETRADPLPIDAPEAVRRAEALAGITLAADQRRAFEALRRAEVVVLTGGPGTGKTTLLSGLTACLGDLGLRVALAAPTGRAARRMAESTGRDARTIHRLLEFQPKTMGFERSAQNPLEEDVIVVDEVSMVDVELFASLLDALRPSARLILVGDPDQLPSVGPGRVLADLLELGRKRAERLAVVRLTEVFRQARASMIVTGAHDVLAGRDPLTGARGEDADLFLVERDDPEACLEVLKELVSSRIPNRFGLDPLTDVQVLTPMHKGLLGATNLNRELQELLNPGDEGELRYRVDDKVMQTRNNYEFEVFNGDIGRVSAIGLDPGWVEVTFPDRQQPVRYPAGELDQTQLAYACSVHKSQGSEYPAVVIPLHTQHYVMLQRNLLYTAITRGKRLVVIVGSRRALHIAVRNDRQTERNSGLVERVAHQQLSC
jgi:exodeoxyribonuclease V alpha subunit